jgi:uncharacterized protein (TIGR03083 family)
MPRACPADPRLGTMSTLADQVIAALRTGHDDLVSYVTTLDEQALSSPSGAADWTVSQVLSHLGSGAEISQASLQRALDGAGAPPEGFNQGIWARWDAMGPVEHRDGFIEANRNVVELYESLDEAARENVRVDLGFLPAPVPVAQAGWMRLNEFALHTWDVKVAADPAAAVAPEAVPLLGDGITGLLGWIAKPHALGGRHATLTVVLTSPDRTFGLELGDAVTLTDTPSSSDGTLSIPGEAWLRLLTGRLAPAHTPDSFKVDGPLTLDDLRNVFPGY